MPGVGWNHDGVTFIQFRFLISGDSVLDPTLNHYQCLRAIGVVMAAISVAWFQDATADGHIIAVAQGPIREPGELAPVEFLTLRFAVREDLNVGGHGRGSLK